MMAEKTHHSQVIPQVESGQTKAKQVWSHLSPPQQEQILARITQICQMLVKEAGPTREVAHEARD